MMISKYHKTAENQALPPMPEGYLTRKSLREKSRLPDYQAISLAESRGDALLTAIRDRPPVCAPCIPESGRSSACYKVHNSPNLIEREKNPSKSNDSFFTGASSTAYLGSPQGNTGRFYRLDRYRTSAIFRRFVKTPKYISQKIKRPLTNNELDLIGRYIDDEKHGFTEKYTDPKIQQIFAGSSRGKINHFSRKSRHNLKHAASNSFPLLISQFVATYGVTVIPQNGRETKKHLDRFLKAVRKKIPHAAYLWILEFQESGVPHYHIYFSFPVTDKIHKFLARVWVRSTRATGDEERKMLLVHNFSQQFISWDMKKGGYLTKYLTKASQKKVPPNFHDVGRFWASSRNLVPEPERIDLLADFSEITIIDKITGEAFTTNFAKDIYRINRRKAEADQRAVKLAFPFLKFRKKSRITAINRATTELPCGGLVITQYLSWKDREALKQSGLNHENIPF